MICPHYRIKICACNHHYLHTKKRGKRLKEYVCNIVYGVSESTHLLSEEMGAECEGVTAGEGMW